jgi:cell division protein FtsZ
MKGAKGVIVNVTGGFDMTLYEVDEACNRIREEVDPNANIIFGSTFDEQLDGIMRVSVVATGMDSAEVAVKKPSLGVTVNAVTAQQQERKLERSVPNHAAIKEPQKEVVGAPSVNRAYPAGAPGFITTPSAPAMPAAATASAPVVHNADEPDAEMFEQQKFEEGNIGTSSPLTAPQAKIHNDSFIPPLPIAPEREKMEAGIGELSAQRAGEGASAGSSLSLKPPVPGAGLQSRKKLTPSLFERFTGPLLGHHDEVGSSDEGESSAGEGGMASQPRNSLKGQGSLDIDADSKSSSEDELDIPAFLRRQAN